MTTLEEVSTWSLDEIRAGIASKLPEGWVFEEKARPGGAVGVRIYRLSPEGTPVVEWQDIHIDSKYLLLGAFGFLWLRNIPRNPDSPWIRRSNPTREAMTRRVNAFHCTTPDPPDVDPEEVQAVYKKKPLT